MTDSPDTLSENYLENYLKAVEKPIPELKSSFLAELDLLKGLVSKNSTVLEIGCGIGRPAEDLAKFVKHIEAVDHNLNMIKIAKERINVNNVNFSVQDAFDLSFSEGKFDLSYSTYNAIGSISQDKTLDFIREMTKVTKNGGKVVNITWKEGKFVTEILKKHYSPLIGIKVIDINEERTITSHGIFKRFTKQELKIYYEKLGLKEISFVEVGPAWMAAIGVK